MAPFTRSGGPRTAWRRGDTAGSSASPRCSAWCPIRFSAERMIAYGTSKAAVIGFVRQCAAALGPAVRVNGVAPGLRGDRHDRGRDRGGPRATDRARRASEALRARVEEIAELVALPAERTFQLHHRSDARRGRRLRIRTPDPSKRTPPERIPGTGCERRALRTIRRGNRARPVGPCAVEGSDPKRSRRDRVPGFLRAV